jgi:hypothetical protein
MRRSFTMPNEMRPIMLIGDHLSCERCTSCGAPISRKTGMPLTPAHCRDCHPDAVDHPDITGPEIETLCAIRWDRVLPDGTEVHVETEPWTLI